MQLEKVTAQVRPRPAWEAVDLGFMMLQKWLRPTLVSWVVITLPFFVVINYFFYDRPVLAAFLFWWLLPIFDRVTLHILSRALFSEVISVRGLLKDWHRIFLPHLIKSLTLYRLDFARSYNLPVWQLEKLKGRARAERSRVLKKLQYSAAVGLGLMGLMMDFIVFVGLFGLVMMFMPEYYAGQMALALFEGGDVWWVGPVVNLFVYLTLLIVSPFYVAGGFSLYINRRTELEGWDIEIVFRQLLQRAGRFSQAAAWVFAFLIVFQGLGLSQPVLANDAPAPAATGTVLTNEQAKQAIKDVMSAQEFGHKRKVAGWYRKHKPDEDKKKSESGSGFKLPGFDFLGNTIAAAGQILLWLLVAALIVAAVYLYNKWAPTGGKLERRRQEKAIPKSLFGLEITPESLPDDVGNTAMELWNAGKVVEALSLLYRGALTTLVHRDGINLKGSATEGDCIRTVVRHAQKIAQPTQAFFKLLTRQWQFAAYAHRLPEESVMAELCRDWREHFGGGK